MANSPLAQAWLRTVNASKTEKDSSEKDVKERLTGQKTTDVTTTPSNFEPQSYSHEDKSVEKEHVRTLFKKVEAFLKDDSFEQDLRDELEKSNPEYMTHLVKRRKDMEKSDHGIVIAGETSAGKSTLINKILGKKVFQGKIFESTSTICKIRNSDTVSITVELESGKKEVKDLTESCDPETKEGEKLLRNSLKNLTDLTSSKESTQYRSVDIGFPNPFLKGDTILVDTPGIGGSGEVTQKLMEYIPNAVSFIFVINVASAGGMQRDRLPEILRQITLKQMDNEMPCFDPRDVLFVTNKWDALYSDDDDEDEEAETWNRLTSQIKELWPSVNEKHIFKMSLKEISSGAINNSVKQFEEFKDVLNCNIEKAENARAIQHLRFLQDLLRTLETRVRARLDVATMSEEEQRDLVKKHNERMKTLTEDCMKIREALLKKVKKTIETTAQSCYDYMSTDFGKERILNPPEKTRILKVKWVPSMYCDKIDKRVLKYVENFIKSEEVQKKFDHIKDETVSFYKNVCSEVFEMESEWMDKIYNEERETAVEPTVDISTSSVVGVLAATSPIWVPFVAAGIGLAVAFAGVAIALSPVLLPLNAYLGREERKKKLIDKEYENCKATVRSTICNQLEMSVGAVLTKLIDNVTVVVLPRRIEGLKHMTEQLLKSRKGILAKHSLLINLESKIKEMEENIKEIQK